MATVKFRIRGNKNKNVTIYIYLSTGRGNFLETSTGFTVLPKDWSTSTNKPKQNSVENRKTFSELLKLEEFIYSEVNKANSKGKLMDVNWLKEKIDECFERVKKTDHSLIINHTQYIINNANTRKIKGSNKIGLSKNRLKGYKSFKKILEEYEKSSKKKIHFQDINKALVDRFTNWLLNTKNYSTNSAGKTLDNLKTVCLDAGKLDIKINDYVDKIESFKEQREDRYIQTLSFKELEQIRNATMKTAAQENARNWLLIGCEIGQRGGDLLKLSSDNLRYNGNKIYLDIEQEKTSKDLSIRILSPFLKDIIENSFPYPISQQKLNKHIKEVCRLARIEELVEGKKFDNKTKRKKFGVYPKWQLITTHCFRRSFATNYYGKMPTPIIMKITKHYKESTFLDYINEREDKDLNADLFAEFYEKIHRDKKPQLKVIKQA
jgi:integrase